MALHGYLEHEPRILSIRVPSPCNKYASKFQYNAPHMLCARSCLDVQAMFGRQSQSFLMNVRMVLEVQVLVAF